jgi:signal transduction histidine kinase
VVGGPPTPVLLSAAGVLLAADVPLPVELSAMAMVGLVLRWLIRRDSRKDRDMEERVQLLEQKADEQRHLKHEFRNRVTVVRGSLELARQAAEHCTCGAMDTVKPLLDQILSRPEPT